MSRRFLFVSGNLSGLLMGAMVVWIYFANRPVPVKVERIPVYQVSLPEAAEQGPSSGEANEVPAPSHEWPSFQFNGKPVFIVPLVN